MKLKLNLYLLKKNINFENKDEYIDEYSKEKVILNFDNGFIYVKNNGYSEPKWKKELETKILGEKDVLKVSNTSSSGAIIVFNIPTVTEDGITKNITFIATFGILGRYCLKESAMDPKFGLYTVNKIFLEDDKTNIKSTASRVKKSNATNKKINYAETEGYDVITAYLENNEDLRELAITDLNHNNLERAIGKLKTLNITLYFPNSDVRTSDTDLFRTLEKIPNVLSSIYEIYNSIQEEDVKKLFKGIYPLFDNSIESDLNQELIKNMEDVDSRIYLFEPEIDYDITQVDSYSLLYNDWQEEFKFTTSNFLEILSKKGITLTIDVLKEAQIILHDIDGRDIKRWELYKCIYGEIEYNNEIYILSDDEWFKADKNKYNRITTEVDNADKGEYSLPQNIKNKIKQDIRNYTPSGKEKTPKERLFNTRLAEYLDAPLFDELERQIVIEDGKIEVCDVLHTDNNSKDDFYHVKANSGVSAISHLFNQGMVSLSAYRKPEFTSDYLTKVNRNIDEINTQKRKSYPHLDKSRRTVIKYLIINKKKENKLTFFAKTAFDEIFDVLRDKGADVEIYWVRDVYPN